MRICHKKRFAAGGLTVLAGLFFRVFPRSLHSLWQRLYLNKLL